MFVSVAIVTDLGGLQSLLSEGEDWKEVVRDIIDALKRGFREDEKIEALIVDDATNSGSVTDLVEQEVLRLAPELFVEGFEWQESFFD
jgi:hypothetical protein